MTNLYPQNESKAWVGLSRPVRQMAAPGITVLASDNRYDITVPLAWCDPADVHVEVSDSMLAISTQARGTPSEDLDDVFANERATPQTHYVIVERDLDPDSITALYIGDALVISARRLRRTI